MNPNVPWKPHDLNGEWHIEFVGEFISEQIIYPSISMIEFQKYED